MTKNEILAAILQAVEENSHDVIDTVELSELHSSFTSAYIEGEKDLKRRTEMYQAFDEIVERYIFSAFCAGFDIGNALAR